MNTLRHLVCKRGREGHGARLGLQVGAKLELGSALYEGDLSPPFWTSLGWGEGWPGPELPFTSLILYSPIIPGFWPTFYTSYLALWAGQARSSGLCHFQNWV